MTHREPPERLRGRAPQRGRGADAGRAGANSAGRGRGADAGRAGLGGAAGRPSPSRAASVDGRSRPATHANSAPRATSATRPGAPTRGHLPRVGDPRRRQNVILTLSFIIVAVFVIRLVDVQIVNAAPVAQEALSKRLVERTVVPARADIVDRNGDVLATSVERYNLWVDQNDLAKWKRTDNGKITAQGPLDAAEILAPILGVSESDLAAQLVGGESFRYIAKNVTPEVRDLVLAEDIAGIDAEPTTQRLYPTGNIGGSVVGYMAEDGVHPGQTGMGGIERTYNDVLTGTPGTETYERSRYGTVIPAGQRSMTPAQPGSQVQLTIDRDIQFYTYQALEEAVNATGSSGGTIVVLDTLTNQVLAIADSGSVDSSNPGATPANQRGSRAVEGVFDPGSTAKTITMAAALEEGVATPESQYVAPYEYITENGQTFKDSHPHADQPLTLAGILVSSSNTGTVQIGQLMSDETRYNYMRAFGLGEVTGVGLPNESAGILHPWQDWDGRTKYATMFGQGVSVTAIQTAQVYSIIANGGMKTSPTVVAGTRAADGTFTPTDQGEPVRVISQSTADTIMAMLEEVVTNGTGSAAQIAGYRVGGKTGTAQAPDENGQLTRTVASFVGIAPTDHPRIVVSVILYDPISSIWGGDVAAPVFRAVAAYALQTLRVPPSTGEPERFPTTWE